MLNGKVYDICAGYFLHCPSCPLYNVCAVSTKDMPGRTIEEKTKAWEARMNEAAKEVNQ